MKRWHQRRQHRYRFLRELHSRVYCYFPEVIIFPVWVFGCDLTWSWEAPVSRVSGPLTLPSPFHSWQSWEHKDTRGGLHHIQVFFKVKGEYNNVKNWCCCATVLAQGGHQWCWLSICVQVFGQENHFQVKYYLTKAQCLQWIFIYSFIILHVLCSG